MAGQEKISSLVEKKEAPRCSLDGDLDIVITHMQKVLLENQTASIKILHDILKYSNEVKWIEKAFANEIKDLLLIEEGKALFIDEEESEVDNYSD